MIHEPVGNKGAQAVRRAWVATSFRGEWALAGWEEAMARCPDCKTKIAAWRTWLQTNSTQLTCRECGAVLRMNRAWWTAIGGSGVVVGMLVIKPAFRSSPGLGIAAIVVVIGAVLWLSATVVPVEKV
jgi:hypothetical protein